MVNYWVYSPECGWMRVNGFMADFIKMTICNNPQDYEGWKVLYKFSPQFQHFFMI